MSRDFRAGQAKFIAPPTRYDQPDCTYGAALVPFSEFLGADLVAFAFLLEDVGDCSAAAPEFYLAYLLFLGFSQDPLYKISASQYPLIRFFFPALALHGKYLGPAALAADQSASGQFRPPSLPGALFHEFPVGVPRFLCCFVELQQNIIDIHPRAFSLVHDCAVPAPGIAVQFFQGLYFAGSKRIEMDVANQGKEIIVFIAEDGFVAVLEEMAGAAVTSVEVQGVPGEELAHESRDARLVAFEENVYVIVQQCPGIDCAFSLGQDQPESFEEPAFVFVVTENVCLVDSSNHDVVQGTGDIQAGLAWHKVMLTKALSGVKIKAS